MSVTRLTNLRKHGKKVVSKENEEEEEEEKGHTSRTKPGRTLACQPARDTPRPQSLGTTGC